MPDTYSYHSVIKVELVKDDHVYYSDTATLSDMYSIDEFDDLTDSDIEEAVKDTIIEEFYSMLEARIVN